MGRLRQSRQIGWGDSMTRWRNSSSTQVRRQGFTLLEVLIASVILSMAVAALAQAIVSGQFHAYESLHRMRGAALGQALMEEITSLPYRDPQGVATPGPEGGQKRRDLFDNMDDFHGYVEKAGSLVDHAGLAYDKPYQRFSRSVTAAYKTLKVEGVGDVPGLEITVVTTDEDGKAWELVRFMPQPTQEATP